MPLMGSVVLLNAGSDFQAVFIVPLRIIDVIGKGMGDVLGAVIGRHCRQTAFGIANRIAH